jgi:rfaE bifunctional protein kinase chain/domain
MAQLKDWVGKFAGQKVVVLGDLVIDEYIYGSPRRISREAPVLIMQETGREVRLGSAGNVVANIRSLGGAPVPVGLVGVDEIGNEMLELVASRGISTEGILVDPTRLTTTKTRVLAGGRNTVRQQMLRIDRLNENSVEATVRNNLVEHLRWAVEGADAFVVSDYGEGVVEAEVFEEVLRVIEEGRPPVFVDSRYRIEHFRKAHTLIPSEPELWGASKLDVTSEKGIEKAGRWLLHNTECQAAMVKRGRKGVVLFEVDKPTFKMKAYGPREVADRTGAGDTVLAAYSLALSAGASAQEAASIANTAGGISVTKSGTAVVEAGELSDALEKLG